MPRLPMTLHPPRYSTVPWLSPSDLDEGRRAMWDMEYHDGQEHASCWAVTLYEPSSTRTMYMVLHAARGNGNDGGHIGIAQSDTPHFDVYARERFSLGPPR